MRKFILSLSALVLISATIAAQNKLNLKKMEDCAGINDSTFILKLQAFSKDSLAKFDFNKNFKLDSLKLNKKYLDVILKYKDLGFDFSKDTAMLQLKNLPKFDYKKEAKKYQELAQNYQSKNSIKYNMPIYIPKESIFMPNLKVESKDKMPILKLSEEKQKNASK